jgi:polyhydroxyalkanoate synthesis repressor PhaR
MKKTAPQPIIIKKYENRRLYNSETSQYINQDQVAQLVRDGHDVRVIDASTGEDLTRVILAQIVVEDAKSPNSLFPLDVLRQLILVSGRATQETSVRYMQTMMDMYQNAYRALPPVSPFELLQRNWEQARPATPSGGGGRVEEGGETQSSAPFSGGTEIAELKRRVEELESLLTQRPGKKTPRKSKPRRRS